MKHCVLILQLSHLCIFDLMISKLQFNLKFNHPSNISFFNLTQIVFLLFSLNIIVKLAVRFHIIFWSKLLHRLFQIYSCICVYLVLYLYFQLKYLLFKNCTWQLSLWRCTLRCCVRIQIYCFICIYFFMCLYSHFSSKGSSQK